MGLVLLLLGAIAISGCGGGGSGSSDPSLPPSTSPDFTIQLNPSSISISPNGTTQLTLFLIPTNGFTGMVSFTVKGEPFGVIVSPAFGSAQSSVLASGFTITLTANPVVAGGNYTLTVQATSGSLSASATTSLTTQGGIQVSLENSSLTLVQGSSVADSISLLGATNDFSANMSMSGLPDGVTASFSQNPLVASAGGNSFTLTAAANATPVQNISATLEAVRTSDGATASVSFFLTVAPPGNLPGNRTNFVNTDDTPSSIVFDSIHSQIFAALPDLARVSVISPATGQVIKNIPVPDAQGLSLSPDGTRVLVTGSVQQAVWIDTSLLQIVERETIPMAPPSCSCLSEFISPGAPMVMSNGKVLFNGLEWNPLGGTFTELTGISLGARSADGTKAILQSNSGVALYDAASDSITATHSFSAAPLMFAANLNGSQFVATITNGVTYIFDGQLNIIGEVPVPGQITAMQYSPDGRNLYVVSVPTPSDLALISTVNATTFALVGQTQAFQAYAINITHMDVDSTGMVFGAGDAGVVLDDSTDFRTITSQTYPVFGGPVSPAEGPLNASTQVVIDPSNPFDSQPDVWFGNFRGTNPSLIVSPSAVQVTAPPSSVVGPVMVKLISPDGMEGDIPDGFTYGSLPVTYGTIAASPSGGVSADLFGYGFSADVPGAPIHVATASGSATVTANVLADPYPLSHLQVVLPPGTPGVGNITVTSPAGTATFVNGLQYVQSVTSYSSNDTFKFVVHDPRRNQLYLSAGDHIDVFSLTSQSFQSPIVVPSLTGMRQLLGLAMTPDNSTLLAANFTDNSVAVINPDNPSAAKAVQIVPTGTGNGSVGPTMIAATSAGMAFIDTANGSESSGTTLNLYQLNLSSLQVSAASVPGLNLFSVQPANLFGARSGNAAFAFFGGDSGGSVYSWSADSGTWTMIHNTENTLFDGSCSGDGNVSAIDMASGQGFASTAVEFLDPQTNLLARTGLPEFMYAASPVRGMKLSDAGSLAYVPAAVSFPYGNSTETAVDIYDVNRNEIRERVFLSQSWPQPTQNKNFWNGLAIDPAGQNIFLITNEGLTIVTLDQVPLSIGYVTPQSGSAGTLITIRGSGFVRGVTATFNGVSGTVSFVDANTLTATVPSSLPSGAVSISLTNPDGSMYAFDAAFKID